VRRFSTAVIEEGCRMGTKSGIVAFAAAAALAAAGCASGSPNPPSGGAAAQRDLLVLDIGSGVRVQDGASGAVVLDAPGGVATPVPSTVAAATSDGTATMLRMFDGVTGALSSSARLDGDLSVRVASQDGGAVALMAPPAAGATPWTPVPRATTRIVIAHPSAGGDAETYRLRGNYEPEAFSIDGSSLFMISYLPPTDPAAYRVMALDLGSGKVRDVFGRSKVPPETMSGTRLTQVPAPSGGLLYTLYTNQPAAYAPGANADSVSMERDAAFIHTLSLRDGWAFCVDLPDEFGTGDLNAKAIAASPDGRSVYVVDAQRDLAVTMDARKLDVGPAQPVTLGLPSTGAATAEVGVDGTLYVGRGTRVVAVDPHTYTVLRRWSVRAPLTGFAFSPDGRRLYAAEGDEIELLDPASGRSLGVTPAPGVQGIVSVQARA
jgi:hypothetical protein